MRFLAVWIAILALVAPAAAQETPIVRLGSKNDIETAILGEVLAALAEDVGADARTDVVSGGSGLIFAAIENDEVDAYVEYTGTLLSGTLSTLELEDVEALREELRRRGLGMTEPLGFNNTYALAVTRETAERLDLETTSDLRDHPDLRVAVSSEWFGRPDGWPSLKQAYGLPQTNVTPVTEHRFLYQAVSSGQADVIEVYTTEAAIEANDLVVLEDDRGFFPQYEAFVLYRLELEETAPEVIEAWRQLEETLDEQQMTALNAKVEIDGQSPARVGGAYADAAFGTDAEVGVSTRLQRIIRRTLEHLWLVVASMTLGILVAVPLGIVAAKSITGGRIVLNVVGIVQTIPSIALLVFMIPLLGLGAWPAIVALFLYSLLPMVANTHAGLVGIARPIRESAVALGLNWRERLLKIELPLALPSILAGIKTSAVITVGFATLGGFIGAGGYGAPIFAGIYTGNNTLLLEGAIPAAIMAVIVQYGLGLVSRFVVPRGLR